VACPEGHALRGLRTEGYQALRCPDCGAGIFVLPRSPLPDPGPAPRPRAAVARPAAMGRVATVDDDPLVLTDPPPFASEPDPEPEPVAIADTEPIDGQVQWLDEPAPAPPPQRSTAEVEVEIPGAEPEPVAKPAPTRRPAAKPAARAKAPPPAAPPEPAPPPTIAIPEGPPLRERLWKNRHRLAFVGVIVLVGVTGFSAYRRQSRRDLPRRAEIGRTQGLEALDRGEFDRAFVMLTQAADAVDRLGGAFEGAELIRQAAREAAIFNDFQPELLETILDEAARSAPAEWPSRFNRSYRGRSILIEAHVDEVRQGADGPTFELDYRVLAPGPAAPRIGRVDPSDLELFANAPPKAGDAVLFGARLAAVELDPAGGDWIFRLEPDSGVTITHWKALEALGRPAADAATADADPAPAAEVAP